MSGYLVLVDRLVAGVPISGVRYFHRDFRWRCPFGAGRKTN